ncbi:MAG: hypothetical protein IKL23_02565 [Oscillospiraceae bacterium]|nr:hypothetical protein [Oscillospiraceae bacterium]
MKLNENAPMVLLHEGVIKKESTFAVSIGCAKAKRRGCARSHTMYR